MKFKRCLSVLLVLDELEETEDGASKRGKTREWIRRRQEGGYFTNIVRKLAAEDTPAYHQMIRIKFEDFIVILQEIEADITPRQLSVSFLVAPTSCFLFWCFLLDV